MIEAKTICNSINPHGSRLFTVLCRYPKWIHAEHCRHRSFSFSVSSSRAIPVAKNLEEVRSDELRAAPVWWGREQKGMESREELDDNKDSQRLREIFPDHNSMSDREYAQSIWARAARTAANQADLLREAGCHKSIVNRILEPFLHVNVLCTGTTDGWMNFFGLRLDKAAQPEMRVLAEAIWKEWNEHEPRRLDPRQWHLPFIDEQTHYDIAESLRNMHGEFAEETEIIERLTQVSAARCARLSYMSFATQRRSTISEDLALYDRLLTARHWSPMEHQATPDEIIPQTLGDAAIFKNEHQAGNLGPSWRQFRKLLPNEAIAPLPEPYRQEPTS